MELLAIGPVNAPTHSLVACPVEAGGGTHGTPPAGGQSLLAVVATDLAVFLPLQVSSVDPVELVSHRVVPTRPQSETSSFFLGDKVYHCFLFLYRNKLT